jgi:hypothetical protein
MNQWRQLTRPTLQPGTIPGPPTRAAPILETIAPYKFGMTMTSNWPGFATSCIELERDDDDHVMTVMTMLLNRANVDEPVIHDHVVEFDARRFVFLCYSPESIQEQAITKFHDVGFVNTSHFLG